MTLIGTDGAVRGDWPSWRGADGSGATADALPIDVATAEVVWNVEIPGRGSSTPVVVGDNIYLTTGSDGRNVALAIAAADGSVRWRSEIGDDAGNKHRKGGGSNSSPVFVADARTPVLVAYFRSGALAGLDPTTGRRLWHHNVPAEFGAGDLWWDRGNTPLAVGDSLILPVMETGRGYVVAFDAADGEVRWQVERPHDAPKESGQSYTTPVAVAAGGDDPMFAVVGADIVTLHRVGDGSIVGTVDGLNPRGEGNFRSIASPVVAADRLVVPYGRGETLSAVDLPELSNGADRSVDWMRRDIAADVASPATNGEMVITLTNPHSGVATLHATNVTTGETFWSVDLPKSRHVYSASPLIAGRHVYVLREDGNVLVVGPIDATPPSVVSQRDLDDPEPYSVAGPVPVGGDLLIRTRHRLIRLSASR